MDFTKDKYIKTRPEPCSLSFCQSIFSFGTRCKIFGKTSHEIESQG